MKITNNYNLPKALYNAILNDTHRAGGDLSVTQLLKNPREFWLTARHSNEIEEDAITKLWALFGTAVHNIAERGETADSLVEEFMKINIAGVNLTGILDLFENGVLWDYKTVSVNKVLFLDNQKKAELTAQANIYAYMFNKLFGFEVKELKDLFLMRDWISSKAKYGSNYPNYQAQAVSLPLFTKEQQKALIVQRIEWLMKFKDVPDDELPLCSEKYRWVKPSKWALMKDGNKKAVKLFDNQDEAESAMTDPKHYVEERKENLWTRCAYCSARNFCNQTEYEEEEFERYHKAIVVDMSFNQFMNEVKEW